MSPGSEDVIVSVKTVPGPSVRALVPVEFASPLGVGDDVVVYVDGGPVLGRIVRMPAAIMMRLAPGEPYRIIRRATNQDLYLRQRHAQRERDALRLAIMKVRERGLAMKLVRVDQAFDGSKLVFYFTAEDRVDFRELVRELASEYKTRIELRQIGVRDEAKLLQGYGTCGRPLCCSTFLKSFDPISIKMAKQQDLALNPARLSGLCGRLKCCLRYELHPSHASHAREVHDEGFPAPPVGGGCCGGCDTVHGGRPAGPPGGTSA